MFVSTARLVFPQSAKCLGIAGWLRDSRIEVWLLFWQLVPSVSLVSVLLHRMYEMPFFVAISRILINVWCLVHPRFVALCFSWQMGHLGSSLFGHDVNESDPVHFGRDSVSLQDFMTWPELWCFISLGLNWWKQYHVKMMVSCLWSRHPGPQVPPLALLPSTCQL